MKLRSLLAASLLLAGLAATAAARQKPVESRQGDAFRGPVKSARIEHATYSRVDGVLVEGPRRLSVAVSYTPDGKRSESEGYAPDGTPRGKYVRVYDNAGSEIEVSVLDGGGNLKMKVVRHPAAGEKLTYNGDGSLRERRVEVRTSDGTEEMVYDGGGALKERSVLMREGGVSVMKTYKPDGTLKRSVENGVGGARRTVYQTYNPDGTVFGRRVSETAASNAGMDIVADNDRFNPGPRKTRETREFDARRNLSKITNYVWNEETNGYEPSSVSYYTITYYR
ncbi:MAG TPA: hypothetical protein VF588_00755 [Pyrinomonadaceae bacterium]|jgi:hypothetical protein